MAARRKPGFADACLEGSVRGCTKGCLGAVPLVLFAAIQLAASSHWYSLKGTCISLIRYYQVAISPTLNVSCLFDPSCSNYAIAVIEKYGVVQGLLRTALRLLRCSSLKRPAGEAPATLVAINGNLKR
jgi:uncharacterized protein